MYRIVPPEKIILGLYGGGGFAREVMPVMLEYMSIIARSNPRIGYEIYFLETNPRRSEVNGIPLISEKAFFELECIERRFNVAVANSKDRERLAQECMAKGAKPLTLQAASAIIYDHNEIGEGAIICANSIITSNAKIGRFFHSNIYSYVAHDCIIGDYVTFAPCVHCNGNVHVRDYAYVGTGAIIREGSQSKPLIIGEGALVGMGAVVTRDVPPYTTVVGNPATPLSKP